jgi:hypothetical protein
VWCRQRRLRARRFEERGFTGVTQRQGTRHPVWKRRRRARRPASTEATCAVDLPTECPGMWAMVDGGDESGGGGVLWRVPSGGV